MKGKPIATVSVTHGVGDDSFLTKCFDAADIIYLLYEIMFPLWSQQTKKCWHGVQPSIAYLNILAAQ